METKYFFQEALDLENEIIVDESKTEKYLSCEYLNAESRRLRLYLLDKSHVDRVIIAEMVAKDILDKYLVLYTLGDRNEKVLKPMYCHIFNFLLHEVLLPLHIQLSDTFVKEWENKRLPIWGFYHEFIAGWQDQTEQNELPDELNTDKAKALFEKTIKAGFMESNYQFKGSWYQAAYFAEEAAEYLGLRHKWKPFAALWKYKQLAQTRRESRERFGKVTKQDDIDKIFK